MAAEADYLRAVLANPADDGPRLAFADWLDERGDPRADCVRRSRVVAPGNAVASYVFFDTNPNGEPLGLVARFPDPNYDRDTALGHIGRAFLVDYRRRNQVAQMADLP